MFVSWGQALPWSGGRGWRGLVGHIPRYVRLLVTMSVACTSPGTLSTRGRPARTSANTRARCRRGRPRTRAGRSDRRSSWRTWSARSAADCARPLPLSRRRALSFGESCRSAITRPIPALVALGPWVTVATPGRLEKRAYRSAIATTPCSWRPSTIRTPWRPPRSQIGSWLSSPRGRRRRSAPSRARASDPAW